MAMREEPMREVAWEKIVEARASRDERGRKSEPILAPCEVIREDIVNSYLLGGREKIAEVECRMSVMVSGQRDSPGYDAIMGSKDN